MPETFDVQVLGSNAYRLADRYGELFLMPPHFRTYVASDQREKVFREYDVTTGEPVRTLLGPELFGHIAGPTTDGKFVAVSTQTGIKIVRLADQKVMHTVPHEPGSVGFELSGNGRRIATLIHNSGMAQREADGDMEAHYISRVVVRTLGPRPKRQEFRPLLNFALVAHLSADGKYLAITGEWEPEYDDQPRPFESETVVQIWDIAKGRELHRIVPPEGCRGAGIAFGEGVILVGGGHYAEPKALYDLTTGEFLCRYRSNIGRGAYTLSPDGRVLVGLDISADTLIRRDARTGAILSKTKSPFEKSDTLRTKDVAIRADGTVIVLQLVQQTVHLWTAPKRQALTRTVGGSVPIEAIKFSGDGREILTAGNERVVRRWDAKTGALVDEIQLPSDAYERMAVVRFGPSDWLYARSRWGGVDFNLRTRKRKLIDPTYEEATQCESLSADGWLVDLPTHIRNETSSGLRVGPVGGDRRIIHRFDGSWPAAAYDRGRVVLMYDNRDQTERTLVCFRINGEQATQLWERFLPVGPEYPSSYEERRRVDSSKVGFSLPTQAILWAPDGSTALVLPQREQRPFLIDPTTGETLSRWQTAIRGPHAAHPSQPILATASSCGDALILVDWQTGERLTVLMEQCYPHALAWSPDGSVLVASGPEGNAWVFGVSGKGFAQEPKKILLG